MKNLFFGLALLYLTGCASSRPHSQQSSEKVDNVPNICQSCYPETIRWGGSAHCAPAAISNSLVWLSKNGFPSLQPFQNSDENLAQAQLVDSLGEYMQTSEKGGTSPYRALQGLKAYLDSKSIQYKRIASVGFRDVPAFVEKDGNQANLKWIQEGTVDKNSVWILVGWYKYDLIRDRYEIFDGHWLTVVGYGQNRAGKPDPNILILHDPAGRAARIKYYATALPLTSGELGAKSGKDRKYYPRKAAGELSLSGDYIQKPEASHGIIQGAYRLEL